MTPSLRLIAEAVSSAGGKAFLVGGCVRDHALHVAPKDFDVEVYGLELEQLRATLSRFGEVEAFGKAFGILSVLGFEFSIPRRERKTAAGHTGFEVGLDPFLSLFEASRRRDLTINSMLMDPLTGEITDPHGGMSDIRKKILRVVDPTTFVEDPLRALRVAQFASRFGFHPHKDTVELCRTLDLTELPAERVYVEFTKLLGGSFPSRGLAFLKDADLLRFFPELEALVGVPQDPLYHPEGDVWTHTLLVVDEAAALTKELHILFAALCHDFGKPATTERVGDRVRSHGHCEEGVAPTVAFLERMRAPKALVEKAALLVKHHLAPALLYEGKAKAPAYRRLARKLSPLRDLAILARADHFGRATADAKKRHFPAGDYFEERIYSLAVEEQSTPPIVMGRHLIARGMKPSQEFTLILDRCREIQDERGWIDPDMILDVALGG